MKLNFDHPTIEIQTPAPGHYVIRGHHPKSAITDEGHVVPHQECYVTDEVPSEALFAILEARGEYLGTAGTHRDPDVLCGVALPVPKSRRKSPSRRKPSAAPAAETTEGAE